MTVPEPAPSESHAVRLYMMETPGIACEPVEAVEDGGGPVTELRATTVWEIEPPDVNRMGTTET